jgi:hypothetical protein
VNGSVALDPRLVELARRTAEAALELDGGVERSTGTRPLMAVFDARVAASAAARPPLARVEAAGSAAPLVARFEALLSELGDPGGGHEAELLAAMLRAYRTQARVVAGDAIPWAEQVRDAIGVDVERFEPSRLERLALDLGEALQRAGYSGDVADAVARWSADTTLPPERLRIDAQAFLEEARARSEALLPELPRNTDLRLEIVHDVFYGGYNEYLHDYRGECRLNGDQPWTRSQLRHTVAHEAFPGHHAISSIREAQGLAGSLMGGAFLYYARTPLTPVIEGTCEVACRRLGWAWDEDSEVYERLNRYRKAVSTDVAIAVNRDGMGRAEALEMIQRTAFTTRSSAEARWTFITHPLWYTSFPHYWYGTEGVRAALDELERAGIGEAWTTLTHAQPHTLATLARAARALVEAQGKQTAGDHR